MEEDDERSEEVERAGEVERAAQEEPALDGGRLRRAGRSAREVDGRPGLLRAARVVRSLLPGDDRYGDPLSTSDPKVSDRLGRTIADLNEERPSAVREFGLGALQVWQVLSESQGRGRGHVEATIVFTDLVGFSDWALEAGDHAAVDLVRRVARCTEPPIEQRGGRIVKRLGDGLMAVFHDPRDAVDAAFEAQERVHAIDAGGYRPDLRVGVHTGRPRHIGGDYLGVDVNIAARIAEASSGKDVLVSEDVRTRLEDEDSEDPAFAFRRVWRFRAKGAPSDMRVFAIQRT